MNEGVAITFGVIFVLVSGIGLVLFKEMRTHRAWRDLVEANDLGIIRGLLEAEIDHWRSMRPPKDASAAVWAGVQGMELIAADATRVHIVTSAEAQFRAIDGRPTQIATALDTALATGVRLVEMIFYDVPEYRPELVRVDVHTTFREAEGSATLRPILCVRADRADAMGLDWGQPNAREVALQFDTIYELGPSGEPRPITLPPPEIDSATPEIHETEEPSSSVR